MIPLKFVMMEKGHNYKALAKLAGIKPYRAYCLEKHLIFGGKIAELLKVMEFYNLKDIVLIDKEENRYSLMEIKSHFPVIDLKRGVKILVIP